MKTQATKTMKLAFSGSTFLGALSSAYDAGIENFRSWSARIWDGHEWTVVYEVKA